MLRVLVCVNDRPVAEARAGNLNDLAHDSDYVILAVETRSASTGNQVK